MLCQEFDSLPSEDLEEPEEPHAASGNDTETSKQGETQAEPRQAAALEQEEEIQVERRETGTQEQEVERSDQFGWSEKSADLTSERKSPEKPCTPTARRSRMPARSPVPAKSSASMPPEAECSQQPATQQPKRSRKLPDSFNQSNEVQTPSPKKKKKKTTPKKNNNQAASNETDASTQKAKKQKLEASKAMPVKMLRPV